MAIVAAKADGLVWSITATGNVWAKFGTGTPVAVEGEGHLILAGQTRDFTVTDAGETIALKDAV
ncbi:hypothetical protein ACFSC3_05160 [Sphingomonas floccifaciens]|uniref:Uncharacterized protein n=1 Tax=Sphingomonas floccifaciens TaxID=1844115 RepID=A0ABW4NA79_9SPHN